MANKKISKLRKTAKFIEKNLAIIRQKVGSNALIAEIEELPGVINEQADLLERLDQELAVDSFYYGKTDYEHVTERIDILNFVKTGERKDIRQRLVNAFGKAIGDEIADKWDAHLKSQQETSSVDVKGGQAQ